MSDIILLLDIDGCVNAITKPEKLSSEWVWEPTFTVALDTTDDEGAGAFGEMAKHLPNEQVGFKINVSREMAQALKDITPDVRWLTTWRHAAHWQIAKPIFGWEPLPVLEDHRKLENPRMWSQTNWLWKPLNVRDVLRANPGVPVVWIDDDANDFLGAIGLQELDPDGNLLVICPETHVGLTRAHIDRIKTWLSDRAL